jgi:hypothetical protein
MLSSVRVADLRVACVLIGLATWASPTSAQTRFAWPDTAVDVASYDHVEDCLGATARVRYFNAGRERRLVLRDTLPWSAEEARAPLPVPVVETAKRCSARFAVATVPPTYFRRTLELYLIANRDADAKGLASRWLTAVVQAGDASGDTQTARRLAVIDTIVDVYLDAQPARLAAVESLLSGIARPTRAAPAMAVVVLYNRLMFAAKSAGDSVLHRASAARIIATLDSLPTVERQAAEAANGFAVSLARYEAVAVLRAHRAMIDSLRRSTAAYVTLERNLWQQVGSGVPLALRFPIGERAPAVTGDTWFGRKNGSSALPAPGLVNLVVFVEPMPGCLGLTAVTERDYCWGRHAIVRRLAERFPQLEIILISRTQGYFMYLPPPGSPALEADLLRQWLAAHRVPGALAVSATEFSRLPPPDGRRIDRPDPNLTRYTFGRFRRPENGSAFLIDPDGIVVKGGWIDRQAEAEFVEMIEVLLERQQPVR